MAKLSIFSDKDSQWCRAISDMAQLPGQPVYGGRTKTMATIRTNENIVNLRLKTGETAIVEFQSAPGITAPEGLPELLVALASRLWRSEDSFDQQLVKRARNVAYRLRKAEHDRWEAQYEEIKLEASQYVDPSSERH